MTSLKLLTSLKRVGIVVGVLFALGAAVLLKSTVYSKADPAELVLNVSVPLGSGGPQAADPAQIVFNYTWGYLENLSSPLVQWGPDGQIVAGVAESFEWHGDELHLKIRQDYRTIGGLAITAEDVAFSLKRIIVLARNTHGFIADFLCGVRPMSHIDDECPGIRTKGDILVLKPQRGKTFLVKMLAAIDYVVLLRSEVDPVTLAIKSFRNTTGPYYLEGDLKSGNLKYIANRHHWNYSESMPQQIRIIGYDGTKQLVPGSQLQNIFELFLNGTSDVVTNFATDRSDLYPVVAGLSKDGANLVRTQNIGRVNAVFTRRGIKELSSARRIAVGKALRSIVTSTMVDSDGVNSPEEQFFATFGEGSLTPKQLSDLRAKFSTHTAETRGQGLVIALPASMQKAEVATKANLPLAQVSRNMADYLDGKIPTDQEPHVYITQTDTGWTEDLGLISYGISMGDFFPTEKAEGLRWLKHYVEVEDKAARLALLRDLHYRALSEPWVVPLLAQPYFTLVRKPWVYTGPTLFNSGALWYLRHQ